MVATAIELPPFHGTVIDVNLIDWKKSFCQLCFETHQKFFREIRNARETERR